MEKKKKENISEVLWTYKDLADYLHITVIAARRLVMEKKIPYYKPIGRVFFKPSEIMEWLEKSKVEAQETTANN